MNISKEKFTELAKEHLIALESYKIDKNGNKPIEIFGIEKLYEAINYTHCCKSDSELLKDKIDEVSELAKDFINEVDKKHPFVRLPEEESFYMARHRLAEKIN